MMNIMTPPAISSTKLMPLGNPTSWAGPGFGVKWIMSFCEKSFLGYAVSQTPGTWRCEIGDLPLDSHSDEPSALALSKLIIPFSTTTTSEMEPLGPAGAIVDSSSPVFNFEDNLIQLVREFLELSHRPGSGRPPRNLMTRK
jgi:hypothetical protein